MRSAHGSLGSRAGTLTPCPSCARARLQELPERDAPHGSSDAFVPLSAGCCWRRAVDTWRMRRRWIHRTRELPRRRGIDCAWQSGSGHGRCTGQHVCCRERRSHRELQRHDTVVAANLPTGVTASSLTISGSQNSGSLLLTAAATAPRTPIAASVTMQGTGSGVTTGTVYLTLTVTVP